MVLKSIRVPEALWAAARDKSEDRDESLSDVIRQALERYVKTKK